ncbi:DUF4263 domain-containing protein [Streptomyces sp. NBC_00249]|uniref:Shedu anti-phage system protein SduA domain-containing protein n=1 Tax=Streptomyces sp. NBC_00249 TaxID=2975690 RepID=UPI00225A411F|nr:Shedu anti-phage system protein SduA domain-containing protein [Streptomyces sp. NBC_00249]MCX5193609.1 DUF4263 domain-containing protein [Streptomyces sp. NBC_00249]
MGVRADWSLEEQLEIVEKEAVADEVKAAVAAAVTHMHSGSGRARSRRGGKALVDLLAAARARAAEAGEWQVVRLLQDSVDYAQGRILQPEFRERHRLFQDGARNERWREHAGAMLSLKFGFAAEAGRAYLDGHPGAGVEELLAHIGSLTQDARYLAAPSDRPGRYVLLRGMAEMMVWLERALSERVDIEDLGTAARRIAGSPDALALLAADPDGQMLIRAAELRRRSASLAALRRVAEDPAATEADLQRALAGQYWIFGGQFVGEAARRRLVPGDELDIPLIRGDGALHVVELKRSMSLRGSLVKPHRGGWVPTAEVHDAMGQAANYLVRLDEDRLRIREEFGIETRRAGALVLIGHPALQPHVPEEEIAETLRTLNTQVTRVEVLTYKELLDNAERSLTLASRTG